MILIKGLDMPQGENGLLCLDIYPDGRVFINLNADKGQVATAEQFESKHGHWIKDWTGAESCSVCEEYPFDDGEYHIANWNSKYCPHCGAIMDEVTE